MVAGPGVEEDTADAAPEPEQEPAPEPVPVVGTEADDEVEEVENPVQPVNQDAKGKKKRAKKPLPSELTCQ